ncbi:IS1595 family transposase [Rhodohalobacter sp. 614A]|uniref:IS1595 family transposase n=1 Tax=Rhodohalobacter sp. 614A TaxID=2908649 RepID=UPI001F263C9E|nr:IS1595 family transposase [Rhodohalobacter sp. 614A]
MKNKYVNRSKISEAKFREIVRFFSIDLTAIQIAELTGLNRNTINRYLTEIRKKITRYSEISSPLTEQKIPEYKLQDTDQFSILIKELESKIYTEIIPKRVGFKGNSLHNPAFLNQSGYDLIITLDDGNHYFLGEKNSDSLKHRTKLNRIESFWGNAKSRLAKFKGMHSSTFRYHVKECEFRYNNRDKDLYQLLLKILRKDPLF